MICNLSDGEILKRTGYMNYFVSKGKLYNIIETLNQNIQDKQELIGSRSNKKSVSIGYIQGCLDCINLIINLLGEENEKE